MFLLAQYWRADRDNKLKAREVLKSAAAHDPLAVYQRLRLGDPVSKEEANNALAQIRANAEQGDPIAMFCLAALHDSENGCDTEHDAKTAFEWYSKAAEQGVSTAQVNLGNMYNRGDDVRQDAKIAASWFLKAAAQSDPAGQYAMGLLCAAGSGVPQNGQQALQWSVSLVQLSGCSCCC